MVSGRIEVGFVYIKMCDLRLYKKVVFGCAFLLYFTFNLTYVHCVEIECIPLKSCPTALKLVLQSKHAPETIQFLKISHCGFDKKNQPKVWCSKLDFCVTPEDRNGTCTPVKKCKPFLQLSSASDTSNPQVISFLEKFRCHEILKEQHVCCQNEGFQSNDYDVSAFRTTREETGFYEQPPSPNRRDYDYYDFPNDGPFDYWGHHDYLGDFSPQHKPVDYPSPENNRNRWHSPEFHSDHHGNSNKHSVNSPELNYWNKDENYDTSNNNKRGTSREEGYANYGTTPYGNRNYLEYTTTKRTQTRHDETTSRNQNRRTTSRTTYDNASHERTTSRTRHTNHDGSRGRTSTNHKQNNPGSSTGTGESNATQLKKNMSTTPPTRSTTRKTTPSYGRTTTRGEIRNSTGSKYEGDIIFEDRFEELARRKSKSTAKPTPRTTTTEQTTARSGTRRTTQRQNMSYCETPDRKPGTCTPANNCQHYLLLQNNLDRSKESVRVYLNKFKCSSRDEICCQRDEERAIDNSLFNAERTNENVPEPVSKICGRPRTSSNRIVGGSLADLGEFPWLALLQYPSNQGIQPGCGGALINSRYVLTAAHCVDEQILRSKRLGQVRQVVLGEYDTRNKTDCIYLNIGEDCADPPKTYRVESITPHNQYSSSTTKHDIALLKLDQEVSFTDFIKPICLPTKTSTLRGNETFIIAGWGKSDITSTAVSSPILRKATIPYVNTGNCNTRDRTLSDGQICAGLGNGTDSCTGDSGGPLVLQVNFNFEFVSHLVGVISYGYGVCGTGPSVNTYVPYYIDWINENMKS